MKSICIQFLLCFTFYSAIAQPLDYSNDIPVVDVRISPDHAMGGTVSDWIDGLTFIPLKTKKEDVIHYAFDLTVMDGKVGLASTSAGFNDAFLMFDREGRQIFKTSKKSLGLSAPSNTLNNVGLWDNNFVADALEYTIVVDATSLEAVAFPAGEGKASDSLKIGRSVWYYDSPRYLHERPSKSALKKNEQILIKYARDSVGPMHDLSQNFSNQFIVDGDRRAYATFSYHYKLFELGEKGILNIVNVIFPMSRTIDTAAVFNFKSQEEYDQYFNSKPELIKGFNNIIRYKDYILIDPISLQTSWLAYHIQTGELISLGSILPDKSSDYIGFKGTEITTDGEFLYSFIYPNAIRNAQEKCREEGHSMRPEYIALAKHDNPIVVRFSLK